MSLSWNMRNSILMNYAIIKIEKVVAKGYHIVQPTMEWWRKKQYIKNILKNNIKLQNQKNELSQSLTSSSSYSSSSWLSYSSSDQCSISSCTHTRNHLFFLLFLLICFYSSSCSLSLLPPSSQFPFCTIFRLPNTWD